MSRIAAARSLLTHLYIVEGDFDIALALLVEEQRTVLRLERELRHLSAPEFQVVDPISHAVVLDSLRFMLGIERRCLWRTRRSFYILQAALAIRRRSFFYRSTGRLAPRWPTEDPFEIVD